MTGGSQFLKPAPGPFIGGGRQKKFHLGLGKNHRAGVAALRHHPAAGADGSLLQHERFADTRNGCYLRRRFRDLRPANRRQIASAMDHFLREIGKLKEAVLRRKGAVLRKKFQAARQTRRRLAR